MKKTMNETKGTRSAAFRVLFAAVLVLLFAAAGVGAVSGDEISTEKGAAASVTTVDGITKYYDSINDIMTSGTPPTLPENSVVKLLKDVEITLHNSKEGSFKLNNNVTFDGNYHKITAKTAYESKEGYVFGAKNFTISAVIKNVTIYITSTYNYGGPGITILNAPVIIENVNVTGSKKNGIVVAGKDGGDSTITFSNTTVIAKNLTTSNNVWGGVDVDSAGIPGVKFTFDSNCSFGELSKIGVESHYAAANLPIIYAPNDWYYVNVLHESGNLMKFYYDENGINQIIAADEFSSNATTRKVAFIQNIDEGRWTLKSTSESTSVKISDENKCKDRLSVLKFQTGVNHPKYVLYSENLPQPVAQIDEIKYYYLADAVAAVPANTPKTITMIADHTIFGNAGVTVAETQNITLDLNGFTLKNAVNQSAHSQVILNEGTLTIKDSTDTNKDGTGKGVLMNALNEGSIAGEWYSDPKANWATNVILNKGDLTIESGFINQTASGSICHVIDAYPGSKTTINGGKLYYAVRIAIRLYAGSGADIDLEINGGNITAGYSAFKPHISSSTTGINVVINDGKVLGGAYAFYDHHDKGLTSGNVKYTINGGTFNGIVYTDGAALNISGGTFTAGVDPDDKSSYAVYYGGDNEFSISNGYFTGDISSAKSKCITGGYFTSDVATYVADGYFCHPITNVPGFNYEVIKGTPLTVTFNMTGQTEYKQSFVKNVKQALTPNKFTNSTDGAIFAGWATASDSVNVTYSDGAYVTIDKDMKLYAVWKKAIVVNPTENVSKIETNDDGVMNITVKQGTTVVVNTTNQSAPMVTIENPTANVTITYDNSSKNFKKDATHINGTVAKIVVEPKFDENDPSSKLGPTQDTYEKNDKVEILLEMNKSVPNAIETSIPQLIIAVNATKVEELSEHVQKAKEMNFAVGAMIEGKPQGTISSDAMNKNITSLTLTMYVNKNWVDKKGKPNIKVFHIADNGIIHDIQISESNFGQPSTLYYPITFTSPHGFSAYAVTYVADIPTPEPEYYSSSRNDGYSVWLQETATPTPVPADVEPTAQPTQGIPTASPVQTQQQASSPAPFIGLLAGLGAAAVFFGMRRK